jgi:hypothetical protein
MNPANKTPQARINLEQLDWSSCECGEKTFSPGIMFKRLSRLLSPDGLEHQVPVEIFTCNSCNKIPAFVHTNIPGIPENMKAMPTKIV